MPGVQDAAQDIAVTILKRDLQVSIRGDPFNCLFSTAIKRTLKMQRVWTGRGVVIIYDTAIRYALDPDGAALVRAYDRGEEISIGRTFWLRAPVKKKTPTRGGGATARKSADLRTPEEIKARYARRMKDPKASLDRNSSLILFEDGTRVYT